MSSYALYLCPTEKSLASAKDEVPAIGKHLEAVEQKGDWGGELHMTLCSFAGTSMGETKPPNRTERMHPGNITKIVNDILDAKISEGEPFHITEDIWDNGKKNRRGNCYMFFVKNHCQTLEEVMKHVQKKEMLPDENGNEVLQTVALNPRETVSRLHVSFRSSSNPEIDSSAIRKFLSLLKWRVCIVELPEDRLDGKDLQILSIPQARIGI